MYLFQVGCQAIRQHRLKWSKDYSGTRMCRNLAHSWATASIQSWRLTLWRLDCWRTGWVIGLFTMSPEQLLGTPYPKLQTGQSSSLKEICLLGPFCCCLCEQRTRKKIHEDVDRERTQSWLSLRVNQVLSNCEKRYKKSTKKKYKK